MLWHQPVRFRNRVGMQSPAPYLSLLTVSRLCSLVELAPRHSRARRHTVRRERSMWAGCERIDCFPSDKVTCGGGADSSILVWALWGRAHGVRGTRGDVTSPTETHAKIGCSPGARSSFRPKQSPSVGTRPDPPSALSLSPAPPWPPTKVRRRSFRPPRR